MTTIKPGSWIGIIGGGQLGRMTALSAANLGFKTHIFCEETNSPAGQVATKTTIAAYNDYAALQKFAQEVDVVSFEFENIPHDSVKIVAGAVLVRPSWNVLHVAQNRLREKELLARLEVGAIDSGEDLQIAVRDLGVKSILKTTELGYDGKGQFALHNQQDVEQFIKDEMFSTPGKWIFESWVDYNCEVSMIVTRTYHGEISCFPLTKNEHRSGILHRSSVPAQLGETITKRAEAIAINIAEHLQLVGILAVEFFLLENGELLVNEMAPRPHNSGHWTMDACITSQFEQFVRVITGLPLGSTELRSAAEMINLIGDDVLKWKEYVAQTNVKLHLYGKDEIRPGRKMGHYTRISQLNQAATEK
jgi:5-(carboxyamino)imidazole ribonucleotide synthase